LFIPILLDISFYFTSENNWDNWIEETSISAGAIAELKALSKIPIEKRMSSKKAEQEAAAKKEFEEEDAVKMIKKYDFFISHNWFVFLLS
jgi:hypothetical protein